MGEKDIAEKTFMDLNDVFADIVNVLIFDGEEIVHENALTTLNSTSQFKIDKRKLHEQDRDVFKLWKGYGINLIMFGVENQTTPNKDMPFRIISYDGIAYKSQLLKPKSKKRYPVITLVLYFGEKKLWTYPTNLIKCFNPPLPNDKITNKLKPYISDYKINVFDIGALTMEKAALFKSDFREVAEHFIKVRSGKEYIPSQKSIMHVDEFLKLMSVLTNTKDYEEKVTQFTPEEKKEGKVNMCTIMQAKYEEGEASGKLNTIISLVRENLLSKEIGAQKLNISIEEFEKLLNSVQI